MRIESLFGVLRNSDLKNPERTEQAAEKTAEKKTTTPHGDRIDLSVTARLSEDSAAEEIRESRELTDEQIQRIQNRIEGGFYTRDSTLTENSRKILDFYEG